MSGNTERAPELDNKHRKSFEDHVRNSRLYGKATLLAEVPLFKPLLVKWHEEVKIMLEEEKYNIAEQI